MDLFRVYTMISAATLVTLALTLIFEPVNVVELLKKLEEQKCLADFGNEVVSQRNVCYLFSVLIEILKDVYYTIILEICMSIFCSALLIAGYYAIKRLYRVLMRTPYRVTCHLSIKAMWCKFCRVFFQWRNRQSYLPVHVECHCCSCPISVTSPNYQRGNNNIMALTSDAGWPPVTRSWRVTSPVVTCSSYNSTWQRLRRVSHIETK